MHPYDVADRVDAPMGPCDADASALAYVELMHKDTGQILALCRHHYGPLEAALDDAGWFVHRDARHLLEVKP